EGLTLREHIREEAEIPEPVSVGRQTEPLDAVGEEGNGGVAERQALHAPPIVTDHHLVEAEPLLRAADEEVAPDLRNGDHESRLAEQPILLRGVVHHADLPREVPLRVELAAEENARVAKLSL